MPPGSAPGLSFLATSISAAVEPVAMIDAPSLEVRQRDVDGVDGADQVGVHHVDPGLQVG